MIIKNEENNHIDNVFYCTLVRGYTTLDACLALCGRYYSCAKVSEADAEIRTAEENGTLDEAIKIWEEDRQ